jgi:hypothetical protein
MPHPSNIPLTPQTDDRFFPKWQGTDAPYGESGCRYPKMLTRECTSVDREEWLKRNKRRDNVSGNEYYEDVAPSVGALIPVVATAELVNAGLAKIVGEPVIAKDREHEVEVVAKLGLAPVQTKAIIPIARVPMRDFESENDELREQLAQARAKKSNLVAKRKAGRPKKVRVVEPEITEEI